MSESISILSSVWLNTRSLEDAAVQRVDELAPPPRAEELIAMCSWCRKVRIAPDVWQEFEAVEQQLDFKFSAEFPRITHSICPACAADMDQEMDELFPQGEH